MTEKEAPNRFERNGVAIEEFRKNAYYRFAKGNKSVGISVFLDAQYALGTIQNVAGKERVPGSTRAIYTEVREELQRIADETGAELEYLFVTETPVMLTWANTHGRTIFDWDTVDTDTTAPTFHKVFVPHGKEKV